MSWKSLLFGLICVSALSNTAFSVNEEKQACHKDIVTNFMKLYEKFSYLSEKVDLLTTAQSTENNTVGVNKHTFQQMTSLIEQLNKKTDKIEALLNAVSERNDPKINESATHNSILREMILQLKSTCASLAPKPSCKVCDPNPCLNGGRCEVTSTGTGYQCIHCPYLTSGTQCEHFECNYDNKCFRSNDIVYVVLETNLTWIEAKQKCANEGMALAMLKDQDTIEFVINPLRTIYGIYKFMHIWFGLKGYTNGWQWIDGTPFVDYNKIHPLNKVYIAVHCGTLYLDGGDYFVQPEQCGNPWVGYKHYALCERRVF